MYKLVEHCLLLLAAGYKQVSPIKVLFILGPFRLMPAQAFTGFGVSQQLQNVFESYCLLFNKRILGYKAAGIDELTAISAVGAPLLALGFSSMKGWRHD